MSTLLLSASNYLVQVLAAPNREEIDRAHTHRQWLHITIPNVRKLRYIRSGRAIIYSFLFLSPVLLHLFFNLVVFTNLQANEYFVVPTTAGCINGGKNNFENFRGIEGDGNRTRLPGLESYRINLTDTITIRNGNIIRKYQNASVEECFNKFNSHYVSDVGNVYLVQDQPAVVRNSTGWLLFRHKGGAFEWAHGDTQRARELESKKKDYSSQTYNYSISFFSSPSTYPSNIWRCQCHASSSYK